MSGQDELFYQFDKGMNRFKDIQPFQRTLLLFLLAITVIFSFGIFFLAQPNRPVAIYNANILLWFGDMLMFISIIFGFWKGVEAPRVVQERAICQKTKADAEAYIAHQQNGMEQNPGRTDKAAQQREVEVKKVRERLEAVDTRLEVLDRSQRFSRYTIRLSISAATTGLVIKMVLLPYVF